MLMKDILSVFQYDWASLPAWGENKPLFLKGKTVLVSGHNLARDFAFSLLTLNDKLSLNMKVVLAIPEEGFEKELHVGITERDDLTCCDLRYISALKQKPDIIIHTGLCAEKIKGTLDEFEIETNALRDLTNLAQKCKCKRPVLLSDSRVYGKGSNKFRFFAEREMGACGIDDCGTQLLRAIESDFCALCSHKKLDFATLRSGVILGAGSGAENGLEKVFEAVGKGEETELPSTLNSLSFTYLSDVFEAVFFAINNNLSGVFNISGEKHSASTGMVAAILHDIFGDAAKIKMTDGEFEGSALNNGKLIFKGFEPRVELKTALEVCTRAYKTDTKPDFRFPDEHEGRLDSIQQILIAYLLEVDRICQKHHITWYLGGGTMLGAARHQGFIPWDDDVDIMMLRPDYDRFLEVAPAELPDGMILQDPKKDKNYNYAYAKLRITGTMFATDFSKNHKGMDNGFAFDIFCHDKTANSKIGQKLHSQLTLFWLAMVFNKWNHRRVYNGKKVQSAISNFLKNIFPLRFSMRMLLFTLEMFKGKKNARYLYDGMGYSVHKGGFPKENVADPIRVDFCGEKLPVPKRYKDYLQNHYGDFYELAPISTRIMGHDITLCDLSEYADFRITNKKKKQTK